MKQNYNITDESGDKKYFTQIPNMIVNHSTAYEQSLYLIMKRLAGEYGTCFASLNRLSKNMGVHKTTVAKTITKLLKRKWIKEIENKKVVGGIVRQFIIVDLWKLNIEEYESSADMTTQKSGANNEKSGALVDESGAQSDTNKNYINIDNKRRAPLKKKDINSEDKRLAKLLYDLIKKENPEWYVKPNWDTWANDIRKIKEIDNRTYEQIEWMIRFVQDDNFWRKNILSPAKLREQFNRLVVEAKSRHKNKRKIGIAI